MLVVHLHRAQSDTSAHCLGQMLNYSGYRRQKNYKTRTERRRARHDGVFPLRLYDENVNTVTAIWSKTCLFVFKSVLPLFRCLTSIERNVERCQISISTPTDRVVIQFFCRHGKKRRSLYYKLAVVKGKGRYSERPNLFGCNEIIFFHQFFNGLFFFTWFLPPCST